MTQIKARHWRTIVHKKLLKMCTRQPVTAYRRQPNKRNYLIRAKLPKNEKEKESYKRHEKVW